MGICTTHLACSKIAALIDNDVFYVAILFVYLSIYRIKVSTRNEFKKTKITGRITRVLLRHPHSVVIPHYNIRSD